MKTGQSKVSDGNFDGNWALCQSFSAVGRLFSGVFRVSDCHQKFQVKAATHVVAAFAFTVTNSSFRSIAGKKAFLVRNRSARFLFCCQNFAFAVSLKVVANR